MSSPLVVVVGGGITGLTYAHTLRREALRLGTPIDLVVLDAGKDVGGHAQTVREAGWLVETGPNGFLEREPETMGLVEELGLTSGLVEARQAAKKRFIVRDRKLCQVPDSPKGLITTTAISWQAKLRLMAEPFAPGPPSGVDESVFEFARRRIGAEAAEMLVDTAVSGISAGDSRALSVRAQFPIMVEMERDHGSLVRAMFARRKRGAGPGRLLTFDRGLGTLTQSLAAELGGVVRTSCAAVSIARSAAGWRVQTAEGAPVPADHVVLALPARGAAVLTRALDEPLSTALAAFPYSSLSVVALGYPVSALPNPLDGYGYLVPRAEDLATLGVLWESSIFPGRTPEGFVLLRVFLGGAPRPEIVERDHESTIELARRELSQVMGITAEPAQQWIFRWPSAIAQYTIGHVERVAGVRSCLAAHPGLEVCGSSYDGVSFNHAVAGARRGARALAARLAA